MNTQTTHTDPFVAIRATLAMQAAKRDAIAARMEQLYHWTVTVPSGEGTSSYAAPTTVTGSSIDAIAATASRHAAGRITLSAKRRNRMAAAHGLTADTSHPILPTRWYHANALDNLNLRMTREQRRIIALVRDTVTREQVGWANMPATPDTDVVTTPTSSRLPKGIIDGREVRVSKRGAYGKRGMRATGDKVSQKDHRIPAWLLKRLDTVGIATHPDADAADYDALILHVRQNPKLASMRVYHGPGDTAGTVVAVDSTTADREQAEPRKARQANGGGGRVDPDVLRYAAIVGYIGNVQ